MWKLSVILLISAAEAHGRPEKFSPWSSYHTHFFLCLRRCPIVGENCRNGERFICVCLIWGTVGFVCRGPGVLHKCPKNKIWSDCGTICTPNCATVKGWVCPFFCRLGAGACTCRSPYVFLSGKSGPCVLPKDCPK
ncbi:hypothetical protein PRIEUP_LOCUS1773, partial [Pristimantis euphronides]